MDNKNAQRCNVAPPFHQPLLHCIIPAVSPVTQWNDHQLNLQLNRTQGKRRARGCDTTLEHCCPTCSSHQPHARPRHSANAWWNAILSTRRKMCDETRNQNCSTARYERGRRRSSPQRRGSICLDEKSSSSITKAVLFIMGLFASKGSWWTREMISRCKYPKVSAKAIDMTRGAVPRKQDP